MHAPTRYKMQKYNKQKTCSTHFALNNAKKLVTKQKKSPKQNIYAFWNKSKKSAISICAKAQNAHMDTPKQTWPVVPTTKTEWKSTKPGEQSNFRIFLKQKSWPIRFVQFCLSVTCNYVYVWKHWLPETCVQISTLSKLLKIKINGQKFLKFL